MQILNRDLVLSIYYLYDKIALYNILHTTTESGFFLLGWWWGEGFVDISIYNFRCYLPKIWRCVIRHHIPPAVRFL